MAHVLNSSNTVRRLDQNGVGGDENLLFAGQTRCLSGACNSGNACQSVTIRLTIRGTEIVRVIRNYFTYSLFRTS